MSSLEKRGQNPPRPFHHQRMPKCKKSDFFPNGLGVDRCPRPVRGRHRIDRLSKGIHPCQEMSGQAGHLFATGRIAVRILSPTPRQNRFQVRRSLFLRAQFPEQNRADNRLSDVRVRPQNQIESGEFEKPFLSGIRCYSSRSSAMERGIGLVRHQTAGHCSRDCSSIF